MEVRPPKAPRREVAPLSLGQVRTFLQHVESNRLRTLYMVAVGLGLRQGELLGLRQGELLGLRSSDVDLDAGTLTVRPYFSGSKHDAVAAALAQLQIGVPSVDGESLTRVAYRQRNAFLHPGAIDASAGRIREELVDLVWFVLRRSAFAVVDPAGTYEP